MEELKKIDTKVLFKIRDDNLKEEKRLKTLKDNESNRRKIKNLEEQNKIIDEERADRIVKDFIEGAKEEDKKPYNYSDEIDEIVFNDEESEVNRNGLNF